MKTVALTTRPPDCSGATAASGLMGRLPDEPPGGSWRDWSEGYSSRENQNIAAGSTVAWGKAFHDGRLDAAYYERLGFRFGRDEAGAVTGVDAPEAWRAGASLVAGQEARIEAGLVDRGAAVFPARAFKRTASSSARFAFVRLGEKPPKNSEPYGDLLDDKNFLAMVARGLYPLGEPKNVPYDSNCLEGTALTHDLAHWRRPELLEALTAALREWDAFGLNLRDERVVRVLRAPVFPLLEWTAIARDGAPVLTGILLGLNVVLPARAGFEETQRAYLAALRTMAKTDVEKLFRAVDAAWFEELDYCGGATGDPISWHAIAPRRDVTDSVMLPHVKHRMDKRLSLNGMIELGDFALLLTILKAILPLNLEDYAREILKPGRKRYRLFHEYLERVVQIFVYEQERGNYYLGPNDWPSFKRRLYYSDDRFWPGALMFGIHHLDRLVDLSRDADPEFAKKAGKCVRWIASRMKPAARRETIVRLKGKNP